MHFALIALLTLSSAVQGAHLPRVTSAPRYEGLVGRNTGNPVEDALCGLLAFCHKTVTATASTTTTLAPRTVVVSTTTTTVKTVTSTSTAVSASCTSLTGVVGLIDANNHQFLGLYLTSTAPFNTTHGVTYDTALKVQLNWAVDNDSHHNIEAIGQSKPYFGLRSPDVNGTTSVILDAVQDTSGTGYLPVADSDSPGAGTGYHESNVWYFTTMQNPNAAGNPWKVIYQIWNGEGGRIAGSATFYDPSTGAIVVSGYAPYPELQQAYLVVVTPDMPH